MRHLARNAVVMLDHKAACASASHTARNRMTRCRARSSTDNPRALFRTHVGGRADHEAVPRGIHRDWRRLSQVDARRIASRRLSQTKRAPLRHHQSEP
jgi:hypothetical protein